MKIRVMIHQPLGSYYNRETRVCMIKVEEILELYSYIVRAYVQRIGQLLRLSSEGMRRDIFILAKNL